MSIQAASLLFCNLPGFESFKFLRIHFAHLITRWDYGRCIIIWLSSWGRNQLERMQIIWGAVWLESWCSFKSIGSTLAMVAQGQSGLVHFTDCKSQFCIHLFYSFQCQIISWSQDEVCIGVLGWGVIFPSALPSPPLALVWISAWLLGTWPFGGGAGCTLFLS